MIDMQTQVQMQKCKLREHIKNILRIARRRWTHLKVNIQRSTHKKQTQTDITTETITNVKTIANQLKLESLFPTEANFSALFIIES